MADRTPPSRDFDTDVDSQLVRAVAGGSEDALGSLYDRHAATVFGVARRVLLASEDAEEVVQDVFAQVWREASRYESGRASVPGWLVMITRARAIDRLRARRARPDLASGMDAAPLIADAGWNPERVAVTHEEAARVRMALAALPDEQRSLVEFAYFEGMTHSDIAGRTGTPLGTVKTRLRTAMARLRGALDGGA